MSPSSALFDTGLRADELDPKRPRPILTPWGTMALFVCGEDVHALQAFCPHLAGPLYQGSVAQGQVTCPWHHWRFDLRTGRCIARGRDGPARDEDRLARSDVHVSSGGTLVLSPPERAIRPLA